MTKRWRRTRSVADLGILVGTAAIAMGCQMAVDRALLGSWLAKVSVVKRLAAGWDSAAWLVVLRDVVASEVSGLGRPEIAGSNPAS